MEKVTDAGPLDRIYFDTSAFNALTRYKYRETLIRELTRRGRTVLVSAVNAAELLNTPDPELRGELCEIASRLLTEGITMLDHPMNILRQAAEGIRRGDRALVLREKGAVLAFRTVLKDPEKMTPEDAESVKQWTDAMRKDLKEFRTDLTAILKDNPLKEGDAAKLIYSAELPVLLYEKVPEVRDCAKSPEEVAEFIRRSDVWGAYAGAVAYEFQIAEDAPMGKARRKLPGGADMRQTTYLGVAGTFVCADGGLIRAAEWIGPQLVGGARKVVEPKPFFQRIRTKAIFRK